MKDRGPIGIGVDAVVLKIDQSGGRMIFSISASTSSSVLTWKCSGSRMWSSSLTSAARFSSGGSPFAV
jgi:hypothetical protein